MVNVATAFFRVVRYGVIIQMAYYSYPGPFQHLRLAQSIPALARPVSELAQALSELLAAGASFKPEVSSLRLSAVMRKAQKSKLLGFLPPLTRLLSCEPTEFHAACLFRRQLQTKALEPVFQLLPERCCIGSVLEARHKIVSKAKIVRLTPAPPFEPTAEPEIQSVVQIDI